MAARHKGIYSFCSFNAYTQVIEYLGAEQHWEAHFLAICCAIHLAIHHRRFARLSMGIPTATTSRGFTPGNSNHQF